MVHRIIVAEDDLPIQPRHIDANRSFQNGFHEHDETAARWIIHFLQERGQGWVPFVYEDVNAFYQRVHPNALSLVGLIDPDQAPQGLSRAYASRFEDRPHTGDGLIVRGDDGKYYLTLGFVLLCFAASPAF